MPDDSDMDLTIKLGAFPIYVLAPMNTAPAEIAKSVFDPCPIRSVTDQESPKAVLKNTR